jgi:transposase
VLDELGREREHLNVKGHPRMTVEFLRGLQEPFEVCYEASCGYGWLYEQLRPIAARVIVAHPFHLRLIFRSKRKNDRADAQKLAKLLYLCEVPAVHVPTAKTRAWRSLVEYRQRCVAERTRGKNGLRAVLRTHGVEAPRGASLWSYRGLKSVETLDLPTAVAMLERDQLIDDVRHHSR